MSAVSSFNVGRDVSLDIIDQVQGPLRFKIMTDFTATPEYVDLSSVSIDSVIRTAYIPKGHKLEFTMDRRDSRIDSYFAAREAQYFGGQTLLNVTITETIRNVDQTVSVFQYTGVALKLSGRGSWKGDSKVEQKIEGMASFWRQVQ